MGFQGGWAEVRQLDLFLQSPRFPKESSLCHSIFTFRIVKFNTKMRSMKGIWSGISSEQMGSLIKTNSGHFCQKAEQGTNESTHFLCPMLTPPLPEVQFPVRGWRLFTRHRSGVVRVGVKLRPALRQSACQLTRVPSAHPGHTVPPKATHVSDGHAFTRPKTKRRGKGRGVKRQAGDQRSCSLDLLQVEHSLH